MKELSKEMQMVYDFCEKRKNTMDASSKSASDFGIGMMCNQRANCYWEIQHFIEVNFIEEDEK